MIAPPAPPAPKCSIRRRAAPGRYADAGSTADNRQVFYAFAGHRRTGRFCTQQNKKDAERTEFSAPAVLVERRSRLRRADARRVQSAQEPQSERIALSPPENTGPAPTVILLGAKPETGPNAGLDARATSARRRWIHRLRPDDPGASGAGRGGQRSQRAH